MRTQKLGLGVLILVLLGLTSCTSVPATSELPDNIANATTAADHQRIADYYARMAAGYDAEAAMHEKMSNAYGGYPRGPISFLSHCRSLQEGFAVSAKEARALERAHRDLAASLSK